MLTVVSALLIMSFYLAMNTANIWVLIDDGLSARAAVVLMNEDRGSVLNLEWAVGHMSGTAAPSTRLPDQVVNDRAGL